MDQRPSMADQAYAALKRDILRCRLRPGEVIIDGQLAAEYGMSKTPVRQAINLLANEGLVVVVPRRGTFVKSVEFTEVQDTYRLRSVIEPEAAVYAAKRATPEELDELAELSAATVSNELDGPARNEANRRLHVRIAELSRIPALPRMVNALNEEIERFLNLRAELGQPYTAKNHGQLVETIRRGDEAKIREVAAAGIERARVHMLEAMLASGTIVSR